MRALALAVALILVPATLACAAGKREPKRPAAPAACKQTIAAGKYRRAIAAARPLVRRLHAGLRAPGMSLAVAARGKIIWSVECGYADLKTRKLVDPHTRFRIGSVSKPLT